MANFLGLFGVLRAFYSVKRRHSLGHSGHDDKDSSPIPFPKLVYVDCGLDFSCVGATIRIRPEVRGIFTRLLSLI